LKPIGVYGWTGPDELELTHPVGSYTHLPTKLSDLLGLVKEAREDFERGRQDTDMIKKARSLIIE